MGGLVPPLIRGETKLIDLCVDKTRVKLEDLNVEKLPPPVETPPSILSHAEHITKISALVCGCANFITGGAQFKKFHL